MKVSDLAAELEIPTSAVLEQCQRFGIGASWAGAELSGADAAMLRAELAEVDDASGEPEASSEEAGDGHAEPVAVGASAAGAAEEHAAPTSLAEPPPSAVPARERGALPPTAVGSIPGLIDEVTPPPEVEPPTQGAVTGGPLRAFHGTVGLAAGEVQRAPREAPPAPRRVDRGVAAAIVALALAAGAFVLSNLSTTPAVIFLVWLLSLILVVVGLFTANRARRRTTVHPDRYLGKWAAIVTMVVAGLMLVGYGNVIYVVVRDEPLDSAPFSLGDLGSVQHGRWGYQQFNLIRHHGWDRPSRVEGSCWTGTRDPKAEPREPNREGELGSRSAVCTNRHTVEVAEVFTYDRDADSAYPGEKALISRAMSHCADLFQRAARKDAGVVLQVERPTADGWAEGDHELGCALVTDPRTSRLIG
jgi:hypothetical protein